LFEITVLILLIAGVIGVCILTSYYILKRAKKAYWDLYHKVVQVEQRVGEQIGQVQQQIGQVQQQAGQVQQHLLLEHLADLSSMAKENNLISGDTYEKSMKLFHEMEMDNLQGRTSSE